MTSIHQFSIEKIEESKRGFESAVSQMTDTVASIRKEISDKQAEVHAIEHALVPFETGLQRVEEFVDRRASDAHFDVHVLDICRAKPDFPLRLFSGTPGGEAGENQIDAALCYLFREKIISKFKSVYPGDLQTGLPPAERPAAIKKLKAEIRELEVTEEAFIVEAAGLGISIERRPDASAEIVLEWPD